MLKNVKYHGKTPVKSNEKIYVAENDSEIIDQEEQRSYRSGIGIFCILLNINVPTSQIVWEN